MAARAAAPIAPGPRGAKILTTVLALRTDPLAAFRRAVLEHGGLVHFPLRHRSFYLVTHPADVARVLQENQRNYRKRTRTYAKIRELLGDGLLTSEGEPWRRQRRLVQPALHHRRIAAFASIITELTAEALDRWRIPVAKRQPIDIAAELTRLTLRIVGRTLFGTDVGPERDSLGAAITGALSHTTRRVEGFLDLGHLPTPGRRRFDRALARLDDVVYRLIEERRRDAAERHDLLSLLLSARDEETGAGFSDAELRDQVLTLLLAGHETTATALTWTVHLLTRHPHVQDRLCEEARRTLADRAPTFADVAAMPYTRNVLQESMRLFPPFWMIERQAAADDALGGYPIPGGSTVALSPYLTHRNALFWDDPDRFDPDRFLPEPAAARPRFAYFPFGGGSRACAGAGFAMMEAHLILAILMQRYRVAPVSRRQVLPAAGITLRPRHPILVRVAAS